jgi:hypothetical protein
MINISDINKKYLVFSKIILFTLWENSRRLRFCSCEAHDQPEGPEAVEEARRGAEDDQNMSRAIYSYSTLITDSDR